MTTLPESIFGESEAFEPVEYSADKPKGQTPFDFIKSINGMPDGNMMRDTENDSLAESGYVPWVVNIGLSYFPDTILHANLVNMYSDMDKRPQYEFLLNSIRPRKRFSKWIKTVSDDELDLVCEHYECNRRIGRQYMTVLSDAQIDLIKQERDTSPD